MTDAVELLDGLGPLLLSVDVEGCASRELQRLARGARRGQAAVENLLTRVGMAADRQAGADSGESRDAHETLLGRGRVRGSTARKEAARAEVARRLDNVGDAVRNGKIGSDQLDSLARATRGLSDEEQQLLIGAELIEAASSLPADSFDRAVRRRAEQIRSDHGLAETKNDNLAAAAAYGLLTGVGGNVGGRPNITLVVDHQTMAAGIHEGSIHETGNGLAIPPESISRLACDATIRRVLLDKRRVPIDVGRAHRTATDAQWQAIRAVYSTCAWSDCDRPLRWCQLHHIHEWENGGATELCNLVPLCNRHHHFVHEGGWSVRLHPDRRLDIIRPDRCLAASSYPDRLFRHWAEPEDRAPPRLVNDGPG